MMKRGANSFTVNVKAQSVQLLDETGKVGPPKLVNK